MAECTARCDHDPKCTCVTHRRSDGACWKPNPNSNPNPNPEANPNPNPNQGACWKRAGCSAAAFEYAPPTPTRGNGSSDGDVYDVYVNTARHLGEWRTLDRARAQSELTRRSVDEPPCSKVHPGVRYPS